MNMEFDIGDVTAEIEFWNLLPVSARIIRLTFKGVNAAVLLLGNCDEIIQTMQEIGFIICLTLLLGGCASPGQVTTNTPQSQQTVYPPVIEDTPARQQAAREAWNQFLSDWSLPEVKADLMPVLNSPRSLPAELTGRIKLKIATNVFGEIEVKEALREFIEQSGSVLCGNSISLRDLSLVSFADEGKFFRVVYWQANYAYQIAEPYGELRLIVAKTGELLQWNSSLLPVVSLPTQATAKPLTLYEKLLGRQFSYTTIAGQPQTYKVTSREAIKINDLIVYPKLEANRLEIHLAYPVVVGSGMTWTVFVDAVTGAELDVKQNFAS